MTPLNGSSEIISTEIHLAKEGQIISKDARSQTKMIHGIYVVLARHYSDNLSEEVIKGMREKAEQGIYPSRPPLGYLGTSQDSGLATQNNP